MSYNQLTHRSTHVERERKEHMMSRLQAHQQPHEERVGALPQSHTELCGTPVGPGKDTHGTPVPKQEGRGWPATTTTKTTNDKRPQNTEKRQDKRAFRKQVLTDTWKLTRSVLYAGWTITEPHPVSCSVGGSGSRVRGYAGLGIFGNEGRVIHLFKTPFDCVNLIQTMSR